MKRLLLMLSLICFSWGAGANDFGDKNLWQLSVARDASLNSCIIASEQGLKLAEQVLPQDMDYLVIARHYYLYNTKVYKLSFAIEQRSNVRMFCTVYYR